MSRLLDQPLLHLLLLPGQLGRQVQSWEQLPPTQTLDTVGPIVPPFVCEDSGTEVGFVQKQSKRKEAGCEAWLLCGQVECYSNQLGAVLQNQIEHVPRLNASPVRA